MKLRKNISLSETSKNKKEESQREVGQAINIEELLW